MAAAAALAERGDALVADGDELPDLDDILDLDAADLESDDADTDED